MFFTPHEWEQWLALEEMDLGPLQQAFPKRFTDAQAYGVMGELLTLPSLAQLPVGQSWPLHGWLVYAVEHRQLAWAHALLDHGVNPGLTDPNQAWGGGQAVRAALRMGISDATLVERLWQGTDLADMVMVLKDRLDGWMSGSYLMMADQTAVRGAHRPDLTEALTQLFSAAGGEAGMPHYAALLRSQARQTRLAERSAPRLASVRRRS